MRPKPGERSQSPPGGGVRSSRKVRRPSSSGKVSRKFSSVTMAGSPSMTSRSACASTIPPLRSRGNGSGPVGWSDPNHADHRPSPTPASCWCSRWCTSYTWSGPPCRQGCSGWPAGCCWRGILAQSGGFFLHLALGEEGSSSAGTWLTRSGAVGIGVAGVLLVLGLLTAARTSDGRRTS